jgi:hypothetical protein
MAHKRKDTRVAPTEWAKHLRPEGKRMQSKAERNAAKKEIDGEVNHNMDVFELTVTWMMAGKIKVSASSVETACRIAQDRPLPKNGEYVDGSFEVDRELAFGEQMLKDKEKKS